MSKPTSLQCLHFLESPSGSVSMTPIRRHSSLAVQSVAGGQYRQFYLLVWLRGTGRRHHSSCHHRSCHLKRLRCKMQSQDLAESANFDYFIEHCVRKSSAFIRGGSLILLVIANWCGREFNRTQRWNIIVGIVANSSAISF
jgi:hypothetical protein